MSTTRIARLPPIAALALLAIAEVGCGQGIYVEGTITAEAVTTLDLDGETVTGRATVTLTRPPGEDEPARVTIERIFAEADGIPLVFEAEDEGPIEIAPGGRAEVRFRIEGKRAHHETPWSLACDHALLSPEDFPVLGRIFDTARDARESTGFTDIRGPGTLNRPPPAVKPPPAEVGAAWSVRLGGAGADFASGVAVDDAGNVVVAGKSEGGIDLGEGPLPDPVFLATLDANGSVIGSVPVASGGDGPLVAMGGGTTVVAASFTGSIEVAGKKITTPEDREGTYVTLLDAGGSALWVRSFAGATHLLPYAVAVDPSGNVVLAGSFIGADAFDLGGGPLAGDTEYGAFVAVLDPGGAHLRSKRIDGMLSFGSAAVDASGALLLAATANQTLDFGDATLPISGAYEGWLAKFDASGAHVFSLALPWAVGAPVIAVDAAGDILLTDGSTVARIDPTGAPVWQRPLGAKHVNPTGLAADDAGRVLLAGTFSHTADVQGIDLVAGDTPVFFVAELDASGEALRAGAFGCAVLPVRLAHRAGVPGVALVGGFGGIAALDQGSFASVGTADAIVAKLLP